MNIGAGGEGEAAKTKGYQKKGFRGIEEVRAVDLPAKRPIPQKNLNLASREESLRSRGISSGNVERKSRTLRRFSENS